GRDTILGEWAQRTPAATNTDTYYVDQANNVYFINDADGISFYADTVLIWRWLWSTETLYIPNTWTMDGTTTISGSGSDAIDLMSWTGADNRLGINVGGVRVAVIDVTNMTIYVGGSSGLLASAYN